MPDQVDRAVGVAIRGGNVLTIRRHKHGREYSVLPGGGVEPGESHEEAVAREVTEETGLQAVVERRLWTVPHPDGVAHYFLVTVCHGPMRLGGPETLSQSNQNRYTPEWMSLDSLDTANLQPEPVRGLLRRLRAELSNE